jgi:hypothetical protein
VNLSAFSASLRQRSACYFKKELSICELQPKKFQLGMVKGRPPIDWQAPLILSAQHVAPSVENVAAPCNGAIRAGGSLFAISRHVFASPRHYTVGPAIMENSGLRWVKVDHFSQGRWRIRHC